MTRFDDEPGVAEELARARDNTTVGSRLLFENDRVRVWDITLAPGERLPFHRHRTSYFYRCTSAGLARVRTPEGDELLDDARLDEVTYHALLDGEMLVHDLTNVGDSVLSYTTVELYG